MEMNDHPIEDRKLARRHDVDLSGNFQHICHTCRFTTPFDISATARLKEQGDNYFAWFTLTAIP